MMLNLRYKSFFEGPELLPKRLQGKSGEIILRGVYRSNKDIDFSESPNWGAEARQNEFSVFKIIRKENACSTKLSSTDFKPNEITWVFAERVSPRLSKIGMTFYNSGIVRGKTRSSVSDGIVIIDVIEIEKGDRLSPMSWSSLDGKIVDVARLTGDIVWRFFQWGVFKGTHSTTWTNNRMIQGWSPAISRVTDVTNPTPFIIFLLLLFIIIFINKKYFRKEDVSNSPGGDSPESPLQER